MSKIVLASASPRREAILKQLGIDFEVIAPNISEDIDSDCEPQEFACRLSEIKADDVASNLAGDAIVIAADTIVIIKDAILGKPVSRCEAIEMLKQLQGSWHRVITGFTVIDTSGHFAKLISYETTEVKMRALTDEEIEAYVDSGEPFDKAGGYGAQGIGALLVEEIRGCYFNIIGLPVAKINKELSTAGINLLIGQDFIKKNEN